MEENKNSRLLDKINTNRRGILKGILGVGFAAPVVTTFSMDSLMGQTLTPTLAANTAGPTGITTVAGNTTPSIGCVTYTKADRTVLPNTGYSGPMYFHAHCLDLTLKQQSLALRNMPLLVATCSPATTTRLTMSTAFEVLTNGVSTTGIRVDHFFRKDAIIQTSQITVNGKKVCDLPFPSGQLLPGMLQGYPDLNALLEEKAAGFVMVEITGVFQGIPFSLAGDVRSIPMRFQPLVTTS